MKKAEKKLVSAAINSGHITWTCPTQEDEKCEHCRPAEIAWNLLVEIIKPTRKKKAGK